ncbi:MAG: ATP synthase F1 subunit epsilon [Planctomycetes bacterium]|nr:ATP synthase F1 subunit epsilon [Planctomycetota bacterium]MBI3833022.1 ATP synthase F1 subunit epsilon [Planctomycetota bacterium]
MAATTSTFHCAVITPERVILDCEAQSVMFPAHDGEMGILTHRAPLVCKLGVGTLRVETGGQKQLFLIDGGFAQMLNNRLSILTQFAQKSSEIQPGDAEKTLSKAREIKIRDEASLEARTRAFRRAQIQLKLARSA